MIIIAVATTTAVAHAQPTAEQQAKKLFFAGNRKLRAGDYKGAAENYRRAYAKVANPKILHNLAVTYKLLGRNVDAANTYEMYLRDPKRNPHKVGMVEKRLHDLEQKVGHIEVQASEKDAAVYIDGSRLIAANRSRRVEPGVHTITANKHDFRTTRVQVTVAAGDTRVVQFQLVRVAKVASNDSDTDTDTDTDTTTDTKTTDTKTTGLTITSSAAPRRGRLGLYARGDIDGNSFGRGAVLTVALAYRASDRLQFGIGGIVGASPGAYVGATFALSTGRIRPVLLAGMPVQFTDGATMVGVHAAAGLHIAVTRNIGALVTAGVGYFGNAPDNFDRTLFVPSVGLTWRL